MQEGGAPKRPAIRKGGSPFRRIEDQLDIAVLDGIDDMGTAFGHLIDPDGADTVFGQIALRARGRHHPKARLVEEPDCLQYPHLVVILDRNEYGPALRQAGAAAELAFDESDVVVAVDSHDLASRLHLRSEHGIDCWPEPGKREHRLLDADMPRAAEFEALRLELKTLERFAGHDSRRDLGARDAGHLGDERHRA